MDKKWVLITGALGGIGKALVKVFSENGYSVLATDLNESSKKLSNVEYLQLNLNELVEDSDYAKVFYEQVKVITNEQGISCLINNAAIQILGHSSNLKRTEWQETLSVNLLAPFFLSQIFLNDLQKYNGSIVNISSIHATQTKQNFVAYATSKAALSSLSRNMALDLGDKVRINAIEPAAIATEMLKSGFKDREVEYQRLEKFHPINRIGMPEEIAKLALFLSSEDASFVHGACISASGGIQGCLSDPD